MAQEKSGSGSTLVVMLVLMAVLAGFAAITIDYTQRVAHYSRSLSTAASSESIANGCMELAFTSWRQISRNTTPGGLTRGILTDSATGATVTYYTPPPTSAFASLALPTANMFPEVASFAVTRGGMTSTNETVSNYKIQAIDPLTSLSSDTPANGPVSTLASGTWPTFASGLLNPGSLWGSKSYFYLASADVTLPTRSGPVTTKVRQVFEKRLTTPFHYTLFYMDDLEIHPTANSPLTLYGAVHTNGTLYTATGNLTIASNAPALKNSSNSTSQSGSDGPQNYAGVTYGENWMVGFKPGDTFHTAAPTPPLITSTISTTRGPKLQPYDWDPNQITVAGNPNADGPHALIETAKTGYSDPLSTKLYCPAAGANGVDAGDHSYSWNNLYNVTRRLRDSCGIQIECNSSTGTVTIKRRDGVVLAGASTQYGPASAPVITPPYSDCYALQMAYQLYHPSAIGPGGAIKLGDTIQDPREGGTVKLVTIDCAKIWDWNHLISHGPFVLWTAPDGLLYPANSFAHQSVNTGSILGCDTIYVTDTSANWATGNRVAVRLKNCGRMQINTIVSDLPVYIQGDFNTGTITPTTRNPGNDLVWPTATSPAALEPAANNTSVPGTNYNDLVAPNDYTTTTVAGLGSTANYSRFPCVVVADAVTVLSNNWNDANSGLGLGSRIATNTTINCSIVSGIVPTSGGYYSGGAENFVRLLEDWSNKRLTIVGSQIELWPSKNATGTWGKANVYNEPSQRNWYPEPSIQSVPGSSSAVGTMFVTNAPNLMLVGYLKHRWYTH